MYPSLDADMASVSAAHISWWLGGWISLHAHSAEHLSPSSTGNPACQQPAKHCPELAWFYKQFNQILFSSDQTVSDYNFSVWLLMAP